MNSTSAAPFPRDGSVPGRTAPPGLLGIDVQTDVRGPTTTVLARGEIDLSTRGQLCDALDAALGRTLAAGSPGAGLVVDLRRVQFVDCGGMEVLAQAARTSLVHGVHLRVLPGPALHDLVALVGGWDALVAEPDAVKARTWISSLDEPFPRYTDALDVQDAHLD